MAMMKCPECGHAISDKAKSCPNCGYVLEIDPIDKDDEDINDQKSSDLLGIIIVLVSGIGVILSLILPMLSK